MHAIRPFLLLLSCFAFAACTPSYTQQTGKELAAQARLTSSIDVQRGNQRLLSRQSQICLISDITDTDPGLALLRSMQAAFGGYFVAVAVEHEPMDYLRALATTSCPGAAYLFYVHPIAQSNCSPATVACEHPSYSQFVITIVNAGDRSLMDRVRFSIKKGILPSRNDSEQMQQAFEQLAIELTGSN